MAVSVRSTAALLACLYLLLQGARGQINRQVTSITPDRGSWAGETEVWAFGEGFSSNQFNWGEGNEDKGNKVRLVHESGTFSKDCTVDPAMSNEQKIVFRTPPVEGNGVYYVRVTVDNEEIPANKRFQYREDMTPIITSITPTSALPGSIITVVGKIFTDKYGSNVALSTNGRSASITRVYIGGQKCEARDSENDELYGITLENDGQSDYGGIKCKMEGTYVGNVNVSFIVNGAWGRSLSGSATRRPSGVPAPHQNSGWNLAMLQTYAEVLGVSPATGSLAGTRITITGRFFDDTDAPPEVYVGGTACAVQSMTDNTIECITQAAPDLSSPSWPGNRGIEFAQWNNTHVGLGEIEAISGYDSSMSDYWAWPTLAFQDFEYSKPHGMNYFVARASGYFVPPEDNLYQFYIKADDHAVMWMSQDANKNNKAEVARCPGYTSDWYQYNAQRTEKMSLKKGESYYMEVAFIENTGSGFFGVAMHVSNTQYTSQQTSSAQMTREEVELSVTVRQETQRVTLGNWTTDTAVNQVQTITFVGTFVQYKISLDGASTGVLSSASDPTAVETALDGLVSVQPDTVEVTRTDTADGFELTVEFQSDRGFSPMIEVEVSGGNATVAVTTPGKPSLETFTLEVDGVPSDPIAVDADANDVKTALLPMFGTRCRDEIVNPNNGITAYIGNYENSVVGDSFCGLGAGTSVFLFLMSWAGEPIRMDMYRKTCFAYKASSGLSDNIRIKYYYTDSSGQEHQGAGDYSVGLTGDFTWHYTCIDLYSLVTSDASAQGRRNFKLKEYRLLGSMDRLFVDTVFIGRVDTVDNTEDIAANRVPGARPEGIIITDLEVVKGEDQSYDITFDALDSAYGFPLLGVRSAQVSQVRQTAPPPPPSRTSLCFNYLLMQASSVTTNSTVYSYGSNGSEVTVDQISAASEPMGGTFDVTYEGNEIRDIPFDVTAGDLKNLLEQVGGTGEVRVSRQDLHTGFKWIIDWVSVGGDRPLLKVDKAGMTGATPVATVRKTREGGLFMLVQQELLRTSHDKPQVQVTINNVPSACVGDCTFEWNADSTPTVTAVTPSEGSFYAGTSIAISGSGFVPNTDNNTVTIGGVACEITAATEDEISCDVQENSGGSHVVTVEVDGKGFASHPTDGEVVFTYTADISSISPTTGSLGGGTVLTISGHGFSDSHVPYLGDQECVVVSITYTDVTCITPSSSTAGSVAVTVSRNDGEPLTSPTDFEYDASATPTITALSSNIGTACADGGGTVVISGTSFGSAASSDDAVKIGDVAADILSYSDTEVNISLPALGPGSYPVRLFVEGSGFAEAHSISNIICSLKVTNVVPRSGSFLGGTRVVIAGEGFSTVNTTVAFGDVSCDVTSATSTRIECVTASSAKLHEVDNLGTHPTYGRGYAWNPALLNIHEGDTVQWRWNTPSTVEGVGYAVWQTASASDTVYDGQGFRSGHVKTPSGVFEHEFTREGLYFYSSGPVDWNGNVKMKGAVNVVANPGSLEQLSVSVNGHKAEYYINSGVADPVDGNACAGETSQITGCTSPAPPTPSGEDEFFFSFDPCHTPEITSVSPISGTMNDVITVNATGLGSDSCMNEVTVAGYPCTCQLVTADSMSCTIDPQDGMPVATYNLVEMNVNNRGAALNTLLTVEERSFVLLPNVDSISPDVGSMVGGTFVTITGYGFTSPGIEASDIDIRIGALKCPITELTYNQIVCETAPISQNKRSANSDIVRDIGITMSTGGGPVNFACSSGNCTFTYSESATPTVTDVQPAEVSGDVTQLTITGSGFGTDSADVSVSVDGDDVLCDITTIADDYIECDLGPVRVGTKSLSVHVQGKGTADSSVSSVESLAVIDDVTPSEGSINGGNTVTITGNGFVAGNSVVLIGGEPCEISEIRRLQIDCVAPAGVEGEASLSVTSDGVTYPGQQYSYSAGQTAEADSLSPSKGKTGDIVTITGSGFGDVADDVTVTINDTDCSITTLTSTQIECTVGHHSAGIFGVEVFVAGRGLATSSLVFEYELSVTSVSPTEGSFGGGQVLTIDGTGFDSEVTSVTVCDQTCEPTAPPQPSQLTCEVPANEALSSGTLACDVTVSVGAESVQQDAAFTYRSSLTPTITEVSPRRGGTAGGTTVTITGTGFGATDADNSVTIAGSECIIQSASATQIVCVTEAHQGSGKSKVRAAVGDQGIATQDNADYWYIDRWSSVFTWGGGPLPEAGDFVVVPAGQTLLLDTDTPVLKVLLIEGGELIFDEQDLELQAEYILITNGGHLQVGTEEEPFQHKAIITMHGHVRSPELPIYGAKTLAVREGTLDLHGKPTPVTWTFLADSVSPGDTTVTLTQSVNWEAGDEIVLATTGHRHTQRQNEVRTISSVSDDGMTLTVTEGLEYRHISAVTTFPEAGKVVETRGEVGLLTRNVVFRGNNNAAWNDVIEACPAGFDTGEFATQTCFLGRFGEEIGSDEFGGIIMIHSTVMDQDRSKGRLSHAEVTHAGQAYRLGRYAIHFHLLGNVTKSYVKGCSIHKSFNRAVNIHNTHHLLVERNVIYNTMGGSFFLEDGLEIHNIIQYNLAVFVKSSTSLLNDDITPAAFWVTSPNNIIRHNHAAGGTHFGFWYRMHGHPDGPSFTPDICPDKEPLGVFYNNTVHSQGWYGIWIFENYFPMENGACGGGRPEPAKFYSLTAWNNQKGAEWVNCGACQFHDFTMVNNEQIGIDMKSISVPEWGQAGVFGGYIIGYVDALDETGNTQCQSSGLALPYSQKMVVNGTTFINHDRSCCAMSIGAGGGPNFGGWYYRTEGLDFFDSPCRTTFNWAHQAVLLDMDGSLSGTALARVTPYNPTLPPECVEHPAFSMGHPGTVCDPSIDFVRFSWTDAVPASLPGKNVIMSSSLGWGSDVIPFRAKRVSFMNAWMALFQVGSQVDLFFENVDHVTNISYSGVFYDLAEEHYVMVSHNLTQSPDKFQIEPGVDRDPSSTPLTYEDNENGDYYFDDSTTTLTYLISGKTSSPSRKKRNVPTSYVNRPMHLKVYRCYFKDCIPPVPNITQPAEAVDFHLATERPESFERWSDPATWEGTEAGWGGNYGEGRKKRQAVYGPPRDGDNVRILGGKWIVADDELPYMNKLFIYGVLELDDGPDKSYTLSAHQILVQGGRLIIGWEDNPFQGTVRLLLRGHHLTPDMPLPNGPNLGAKALGCFGGCDIHGKNREVTFTRLAQTGNVGDSTITLVKAVDWVVGDDIAITTTTYDVWQTETFRITGLSDDTKTITLNGTLAYKHIGETLTLADGQTTINMAAEVGLLTRNVQIIGEDYNNLFEESFGARVLVGTFTQKDVEYTGYARILNVEFYHTGQEGWTDFYDPRYSLAFLDVGEVEDDHRKSYIRKNTFHSGFSPAIGVFGTQNLDIEDNVIHHTVGPAMRIWGVDNKVRRNLAMLLIWPDGYQDRSEDSPEWTPVFDMFEALTPVLTGNVAAGSQRAGFRVDGEPCTGNSAEAWSGNIAHSCMVGVLVFPGDGLTPCTKISGFTVWKAHDYGVYFQAKIKEVVVENVVLVDSQVGIYTMLFGAKPLNHDAVEKSMTVQDSVIVGTSPFFDCTLDYTPSDHSYKIASRYGRGVGRPGGGRVGVLSGQCDSKSNAAGIQPFTGSKSYPSINCHSYITNVTFSHFKQSCKGQDVVWMTNPGQEDAIPPTQISLATLYEVEELNKLFFVRPSIGKIHPADCVDMECDGKKNAIFKDDDGSFLGSAGSTVIPQAEYEWDGDPRRGLGDYRIPKMMLTDLDGHRLDINQVAPKKGIVRDDSCTYKSDWQAWECHNIDYEMMIIESMDGDTEMRRLSPVALHTGEYVDLENGPQDHGWCAGYTCQMRISTFWTVVGMARHYDLYFTGTSPQNLRLRILHVRSDQSMRLGIFYANPQRLDIYAGGRYIMPENGAYNDAGQLIALEPETEGQYYPAIDGANGANFFDRSWQTQYVTIKGSEAVDIKTTPVLFVTFGVPAVTIDNFFDVNLRANLAAFLNIPASKIRVVNVVREDSGRKKRAGMTDVDVEITDPPVEDYDEALEAVESTREQLQVAASTIVDAMQLGTLSNDTGIQIISLAIIEPVPTPNTTEWEEVTREDSQTFQQAVTVQVPAGIELHTQPEPLHEGSEFPIQPRLQVFDDSVNAETSNYGFYVENAIVKEKF
ncbi:fibrocystin-L-like [Branchiostoma lanceolatum]|uniref:fibrocystin-L-like n=1 Tax=Branchiostoma lanceolatum TaxID=7740 RepID=UPI0034527671